MKKSAISIFCALLLCSICFADTNEDLILASQNGNIEQVKQLLAAGAKINFTSSQDPIFPGGKPLGGTALMKAALYQRLDVVKLLLDNKADPNIVDRTGYTALLYATQNIEITQKAIEIIKLLVNAGADVNAAESWGKDTPLMFLCLTTQDSSDAMEALFASGKVDINKKDKDGRNAYELAQPYKVQKNLEILQKHGATGEKVLTDEEKYDKFIDTLPQMDATLLTACRILDFSRMDYAVSNGANINAVDINGCTALILCARSGAYDMAKYLLEHHANVNSVAKGNVSALMSAASSGYTNIVKILLAYRADTSIKDSSFGLTAYDSAKFNHYTDIMQLLAK